jgi:hypothetical protein
VDPSVVDGEDPSVVDGFSKKEDSFWTTTTGISFDYGKNKIVGYLSKAYVEVYMKSIGKKLTKPYIEHVKKYAEHEGYTLFAYDSDDAFDNYTMFASKEDNIEGFTSNINSKFTWYSADPIPRSDN